MSSVKGTAVITGASSGIGRVYADRLAGRGYDLILVARREDRLAAVARDLRAKHGVILRFEVADLAVRSDIDRIAALLASDERITLLLNNAGTSTVRATAEVARNELDAMNDINVAALARLTLAVLPRFKERNHGTIINIASVLGFGALPGSSIYSGTKGYVVSFTRALQQELTGTKVVVQLVAPSATATDIWDKAGVPLSTLDPAIVMTIENCVDAALAGLDLGEAVTFPSVENAGELLAAYDAARTALFKASMTGKPASRYALASAA